MSNSGVPHTNKSFPWFIALALLLLVAGFVSGALWPHHFQETLGPVIEKLKRTAEGISSTSVLGAIWTIFFNNAIAALELIVLGLFLGVFPAVMLWLNGVLLGYVTALAVQQAHVPLWKVLVYGVLPHGVFELTAIVWATVLGFQLGFAAIHSLTRRMRTSTTGTTVETREPRLSLRSELRRAARHLPWILALLVVAACVEATVTPHLIALVQV
ncbi:MAG: stage II sporulation protein M [Alicyclobacillus herbarius]|uniref:stage II sporulation protein M n=1 Tax=Alicyclobacillus herbarius TaxID=122960 RepID=UPI002352E524|nr:stage II sporulation protein M [Alicyclobacillus herbarius]MCL6633486.1 stage II sporulation protein M [Alicyclobacillus herbarius]